jgi:hypothetical protein
MSLSFAIALNVLFCVSLIAGLARAMWLPSVLTPHLPAQPASLAEVPAPSASVPRPELRVDPKDTAPLPVAA